MMKKEILISTIMILILVSSIGVYAAGSSTGARVRVTAGDNTSENASDVRVRAADVLVNCEDPSDRRERIKCRLRESRNKTGFNTNAPGRIPEACRRLDNQEACKKLYRASEHCYELEGRNKSKCFMRVAGFVKSKIADEDPKERRVKARHHLVLLLYELQERIEKANENGRIGDSDAAELIDMIVAIKEAILNHEGKDVVKPMLKELREKIREVKSSID
jgi:hypothetical protein